MFPGVWTDILPPPTRIPSAPVFFFHPLCLSFFCNVVVPELFTVLCRKNPKHSEALDGILLHRFLKSSRTTGRAHREISPAQIREELPNDRASTSGSASKEEQSENLMAVDARNPSPVDRPANPCSTSQRGGVDQGLKVANLVEKN